jgi:hypothetical protein
VRCIPLSPIFQAVKIGALDRKRGSAPTSSLSLHTGVKSKLYDCHEKRSGDTVITLIVFASIAVYLLIGILILRPALGMLYSMVQHYLKYRSFYRSRLADKPDLMLPWVAVWYGITTLVWPIAIWAMLIWMVVRKSTPQYTEHLTNIALAKSERELAEANRVIAEFGRRNNPVIDTAQSSSTRRFGRKEK